MRATQQWVYPSKSELLWNLELSHNLFVISSGQRPADPYPAMTSFSKTHQCWDHHQRVIAKYIKTFGTVTVIVRMNFDSWWDVESESPHHCLIHSVFRQLGDYWPRLNSLQFGYTRLGKAPLASLEDAGERSHAAFYTFGAGKNNRPMIDPVSHPSAPSPPSPSGIPPPPCNAQFLQFFWENLTTKQVQSIFQALEVLGPFFKAFWKILV